jgi:hypothetical protein
MDVVEPAPLSGPEAPRLDPGSRLVTAAVDLLARHTADAGTCRTCGAGFPCPPGIHASAVCQAAGIEV